MAKVHDLFVIELAEVIKGYGNNPNDEDPFRLSKFYRFYELPNIAVSRENFEKMRPIEPERKTGTWLKAGTYHGIQIFECSECHADAEVPTIMGDPLWKYCPNCGSYNGGEAE